MAGSIQELMQRLPAAFDRAAAGADDAVVHFKFTGAEAGEWNAVVHAGRCEVAQGLPRARPTISVIADSGDFMKVAEGQIDALGSFMNGTIKVTGDRDLARRLVELLKAA